MEGGRVVPERRGEGQQLTELGQQPTWLTVSPVYKL